VKCCFLPALISDGLARETGNGRYELVKPVETIIFSGNDLTVRRLRARGAGTSASKIAAESERIQNLKDFGSATVLIEGEADFLKALVTGIKNPILRANEEFNRFPAEKRTKKLALSLTFNITDK